MMQKKKADECQLYDALKKELFIFLSGLLQ